MKRNRDFVKGIMRHDRRRRFALKESQLQSICPIQHDNSRFSQERCEPMVSGRG